MPEWPTRRAKQANRGSILRSCAPLATGSVKKPTRPQTVPFLGVGKCIPGPLRVRIAPSGAKFSGGELVVRGSAGFFTDPDARGSACGESALWQQYGALMPYGSLGRSVL